MFTTLSPLLCIAGMLASVPAPTVELRQTIPSPPGAQGRFGFSTAIGGGLAVVGSRFDSSLMAGAGSVSIFDLKSAERIVTIDPVRPEIQGHFSRVATDGVSLLIGAGGRGPDRDDPTGSAFLFDAASGQLKTELLSPSDSIMLNNGALAVQGGLAAVGGDDISGVEDVLVTLSPRLQLIYDTTTGEHIATLKPAGRRNPFDGFGASVAIDSGLALVGSTNGTNIYGKAYLFDATTGEQQRVLRPEGTDFDSYRFGFSVTLNGDLALVGAPGDDDLGPGSGSAYLFDVNTGQQLTKLTASDGEALALFGGAVALTDKYAVVGAPAGASGRETTGGKAYVFDLITGAEIAILSPERNRLYSRFGESISINGDQIVIGASGLNAAFVYQVVPEPSGLALVGVAIFAAAAFLRLPRNPQLSILKLGTGNGDRSR